MERRKNNEMEKHYYRKLIDQSTVETCKDRNQKELHCTRRKVERGKLIYPRYLFVFSSHQIFKGIEDPGDPFSRRANTQAQSSKQARRD